MEDAEADVENCCCVVRFQYSAAVTRVGSAFIERERERESERERDRGRLRVSECAVGVMQTWRTVVYVSSKLLAGRVLEAHSEREGERETERERDDANVLGGHPQRGQFIDNKVLMQQCRSIRRPRTPVPQANVR